MAPADMRRIAIAFMTLVASTVALVVFEGGVPALLDGGETAGGFTERKTSPERTGTSDVTVGIETAAAIVRGYAVNE